MFTTKQFDDEFNDLLEDVKLFYKEAVKDSTEEDIALDDVASSSNDNNCEACTITSVWHQTSRAMKKKKRSEVLYKYFILIEIKVFLLSITFFHF